MSLQRDKDMVKQWKEIGHSKHTWMTIFSLPGVVVTYAMTTIFSWFQWSSNLANHDLKSNSATPQPCFL